MSEIIPIWNKIESPQDMSEVWDSSKEGERRTLDESECGCYPKHIKLDNKIGYMIMPGIYYFGLAGSNELPEMGLGRIRCARKIAVVGYSLDRYGFFGKIQYLAVDDENIAILKKMRQTMGWDSIWREYEAWTAEDEKAWEKWDKALEMNDVEALLKEWEVDMEEETTGNDSPEEEICIEDTAEELIPGIGMRRLRVGLKYIFLPRIDVMEYEYAYKSGDTIVLINYKMKRKEYDISMLEELTVRKRETLRCGLLIDRDYHVIDCREEKEKQMLTREAYELFRKISE